MMIDNRIFQIQKIMSVLKIIYWIQIDLIITKRLLGKMGIY